jgi:hypothetical protein
MSDITLLGAVCLGLGAYCLHLHNRIRHMQRAGMFMVEMLTRYVSANEECTLPEAAEIIKDLSVKVMANKFESKIKGEA